jgi:hypothetical protein
METKVERMDRLRSEKNRAHTNDGFDVVCSIGRVTFGSGDDHPYVAAMRLIVDHSDTAPATYTFPGAAPDSTVTVEIS